MSQVTNKNDNIHKPTKNKSEIIKSHKYQTEVININIPSYFKAKIFQYFPPCFKCV